MWNMTLSVLQQFGVQAENVGGAYTRFRVPAGQQYHAGRFSVEGDYSQAAFFLAYNQAAGEEAVRLHGLSPDSVQGDKAAAEILSLYQNDGDLTVDASGIPDLIPALAVAAAFRLAGKVIFANAGRLRLKESDRLATTHQLLRSLGAEAETGEDFLAVTGTGGLPGGGIADCCNDHRIAMSGAVRRPFRKTGPSFWAPSASANPTPPSGKISRPSAAGRKPSLLRTDREGRSCSFVIPFSGSPTARPSAS